MKNASHPGSLVSRTGLRQMLRQEGEGELSRTRVHQITARDDFPAPLDVLDDGRTPIWPRAAIERYIAERAGAR